MAESPLAIFFREIFLSFGEVIAWILIIAALVLFAALVLLFVFSGANILVLLKKNRKKGVALLVVFVASIFFAFDKNFAPIILLNLYFIASIIIGLIRKIIQLFKKK